MLIVSICDKIINNGTGFQTPSTCSEAPPLHGPSGPAGRVQAAEEVHDALQLHDEHEVVTQGRHGTTESSSASWHLPCCRAIQVVGWLAMRAHFFHFDVFCWLPDTSSKGCTTTTPKTSMCWSLPQSSLVDRTVLPAKLYEVGLVQARRLVFQAGILGIQCVLHSSW